MSEVNRILIRDLEFRVEISGHGKPLVFLHGYGGSNKDWDPLTAHLNDNRQLFLISIKPLISSIQSIRFSDQVGYLKELMETLFPQKPAIDIVSTSYGSALAWALAQVSHLNVDRNVFINPMPLDPLRWIRSLELKILAEFARSDLLLGLFLRTKRGQKHLLKLSEIFGLGDPKSSKLSNFSKRKRALVFLALQRFFWVSRSEDWEQLSTESVKKGKVLIVYGAGDPLFHSADFRQYDKLFEESMVYRLVKGSHLLMKSHPQLLANLIDSYLSEQIKDHTHLENLVEEVSAELVLEKKAA